MLSQGLRDPGVCGGLRDNSQIPVPKDWVEGGTVAKKPGEEESTPGWGGLERDASGREQSGGLGLAGLLWERPGSRADQLCGSQLPATADDSGGPGLDLGPEGRKPSMG